MQTNTLRITSPTDPEVDFKLDVKYMLGEPIQYSSDTPPEYGDPEIVSVVNDFGEDVTFDAERIFTETELVNGNELRVSDEKQLEELGWKISNRNT